MLILGPSGSGKSRLLADLLAAGAWLVADDLVRLDRQRGRLVASAVSPAGLIELRGGGIFHVATMDGVLVDLCVQLVEPQEQARLPERRAMTVEGVEVPTLSLPTGQATAAAVLLALAARRTA